LTPPNFSAGINDNSNYSALLEGIKDNAQKGGLGKGLTTIKNRDVFVEPTGRYSRRVGKPLTRLPACARLQEMC
jgi:hypothetical protein